MVEFSKNRTMWRRRSGASGEIRLAAETRDGLLEAILKYVEILLFNVLEIMLLLVGDDYIDLNQVGFRLDHALPV